MGSLAGVNIRTLSRPTGELLPVCDKMLYCGIDKLLGRMTVIYVGDEKVNVATIRTSVLRMYENELLVMLSKVTSFYALTLHLSCTTFLGLRTDISISHLTRSHTRSLSLSPSDGILEWHVRCTLRDFFLIVFSCANSPRAHRAVPGTASQEVDH